MVKSVATESNFRWPPNIDMLGPYKKKVSNNQCVLASFDVFVAAADVGAMIWRYSANNFIALCMPNV